MLAIKFSCEQKQANFFVQKMKENDRENFKVFEVKLLKMLGYDLNIFTCYDILIEFMHIGFIFSSEEISAQKLSFFYNNLGEMLYRVYESRYSCKLSSKQLAIILIGFVRECLGLEPFSKEFKIAFSINAALEETICKEGLRNIKRFLSFRAERKFVGKNAHNKSDCDYCGSNKSLSGVDCNNVHSNSVNTLKAFTSNQSDSKNNVKLERKRIHEASSLLISDILPSNCEGHISSRHTSQSPANEGRICLNKIEADGVKVSKSSKNNVVSPKNLRKNSQGSSSSSDSCKN